MARDYMNSPQGIGGQMQRMNARQRPMSSTPMQNGMQSFMNPNVPTSWQGNPNRGFPKRNPMPGPYGGPYQIPGPTPDGPFPMPGPTPGMPTGGFVPDIQMTSPGNDSAGAIPMPYRGIPMGGGVGNGMNPGDFGGGNQNYMLMLMRSMGLT